MTMRVLFLDDDESRHRLFKKAVGQTVPGARVDFAVHAQNAATYLSATYYDVVFLDHDLVPADYEGKETKLSGMAVAKFLFKGEGVKPGVVVVHSYNQVGAAKMVQVLREGGISAVWCPFDFVEMMRVLDREATMLAVLA